MNAVINVYYLKCVQWFVFLFERISILNEILVVDDSYIVKDLILKNKLYLKLFLYKYLSSF